MNRFRSILSGDLAEDDGPDFANYADNSRHVLIADETVSAATLLEGFSIRGGYADGTSSDPELTGGAGLFCDGGNPIARDCTFEENLTGRVGGAFYTRNGSPRVETSSFLGNSGGFGAAVNSFSGSLTLVRCQFLDNSSEYSGGAIANEAELTLVNCLLAHNDAAVSGGAVSASGVLTMHNCTVVDNTAPLGGGVNTVPQLQSGVFANSVLWANRADSGTGELAQLRYSGGSLDVDYCCIQGWTGSYGGAGNIGTDPLFADALGSDGFQGTGDEDYRLSIGSPCLDAGSDGLVPPDCDLDLDGRPRILDDPNTPNSADRVDMGAYELQAGSPQMYPVGLEPMSVVAADLDGDGHVDLATADHGLDSVSILFNQGDGRFADRRQVAVGSAPGDVRSGDLDGDGDMDLVVVNRDDNTVSVLLNEGDGSFAPRTDHAVGGRPTSAAIGDLNGDGAPDLCVTGEDGDIVTILTNNGDGTFEFFWAHDMGGGPTRVLIGDLDGDGDNDIATCNADGSVSVRRHTTMGFFGGESVFEVGVSLTSIDLDDVDSDGDIDAVVADAVGNTIFVLANDGTASFTVLAEYNVSGSPGAVSLADLDSDGDRDLVATVDTTDAVWLLLNQGNGVFQSSVAYLAGDEPVAVVLNDLDTDAVVEIAVANQASSEVAVFNRHAVEPCPGDLDGDNDTDQADLGLLLAAYEFDAGGDLDSDGDTDQADLGILLADYGCTP